MTKQRIPGMRPDKLSHLLENDTRGTRELLDRMADRCEPDHDPDAVLSRIMGLAPPKAAPPEDMPAIEKIKLYARSGYHLHHIGTDEDFERMWEEVFPEEREGTKA